MNGKERNGTGVKSFIIANPLYDTVFKRLMENMRIAKFFLSTILEQQITEVTVLPQEFTYRGKVKKGPDDDVYYSIFRIDFMATVLTEDGERKKILIEVQKSWNQDDLMRFRKYLGEQYGKTDTMSNGEITLPITTIYILGFNLAGIESPCVKVGRMYTDMRNRETIHAKSRFIELLTHDSYVIQAGRIADLRYTTNLDKLLSIFEQAYFIRKDSGVIKEYRYQPDDEEMELITSVLYEMAADGEERKQLENEEEAMRILEAVYFRKIREHESVIEEQARALEEKARALEEKDRQIAELKRLLQGNQAE
ncbi:MAG: Rpn family recombination-promoting nuclease/putative transposase [Tannerella sp.]|jgi:hypothetical protein|nr:Rpn family recombination-promoting nuclease/putative transposase [Tannerella sp.]